MHSMLIESGSTTYVKLLWRLAQGCVILLNKVPADFILGKIAVGIGTSSGSSSRVGSLVLLLGGEVTVCGHGCHLLDDPTIYEGCVMGP